MRTGAGLLESGVSPRTGRVAQRKPKPGSQDIPPIDPHLDIACLAEPEARLLPPGPAKPRETGEARIVISPISACGSAAGDLSLF